MPLSTPGGRKPKGKPIPKPVPTALGGRDVGRTPSPGEPTAAAGFVSCPGVEFVDVPAHLLTAAHSVDEWLSSWIVPANKAAFPSAATARAMRPGSSSGNRTCVHTCLVPGDDCGCCGGGWFVVVDPCPVSLPSPLCSA